MPGGLGGDARAALPAGAGAGLRAVWPPCPVPSHRGAKFKPRAPASGNAAEGPGRAPREPPQGPHRRTPAPVGLHGECAGAAAPSWPGGCGSAGGVGPFPLPGTPLRWAGVAGTGPESPAPPEWGRFGRGGTRSSRDGVWDPSGRCWFSWDGAWTGWERGRSGREGAGPAGKSPRTGRDGAGQARKGLGPVGTGLGWVRMEGSRQDGSRSRWEKGSGPTGRIGPEGPG